MTVARRLLARLAAALAVGALLGGCGPSAAEIRRAKHVAYQTEYAVVWNAVAAAVGEQYKRFEVEDAIRGKLLTHWHRLQIMSKEQQNDEPSGLGDPNAQPENPGQGGQRGGGVAGQRPGDFRAAMFFRVYVAVKGGPPWRVEIDGEAAEYKPGLAMLVPFKHGTADEPTWVQPRIDNLYFAIYKRLRGYAIDVKEAPRQPRDRALDTTPWANLPAEAGQLVAQVQAAAARKDAAALRPLMADAFASEVGEGADRIVAVWTADPAPLERLAKLLAGGCAYDQAQDRVRCPRAPGEVEARFEEGAGGAWRFTALLSAGD